MNTRHRDPHGLTMQRLPKHVQFDHEWHDRALSNVHLLLLICAVIVGVIGWGALILLFRFLAHLLGT